MGAGRVPALDQNSAQAKKKRGWRAALKIGDFHSMENSLLAKPIL